MSDAFNVIQGLLTDDDLNVQVNIILSDYFNLENCFPILLHFPPKVTRDYLILRNDEPHHAARPLVECRSSATIPIYSPYIFR